MEEEPRQIWDVINLYHVLGFSLREGGRRVGIKEEEEDDNSAMTNDKLKLGAMGNDRCLGQLVATIVELRDPPPLNGVY
jgi:hypothetical protein